MLNNLSTPAMVVFFIRQARIRDVYKLLTEKLISNSVAAVMFQRDALLIDELDSIQRTRTPTKAAQVLVNILLTQSEHRVYDCFMEALQMTNQHDIFLLISYPG